MRCLVAHSAHRLPIWLLAHRGNRDIADWSLEFDQGVSTIVLQFGQSLAIGAKVGIMANGTLVSITNDIRSFSLAKGSITVNANVVMITSGSHGNRLIDGHKPVAWVGRMSVLDACRAVVKVWAIHALVSNAINVLPRSAFVTL